MIKAYALALALSTNTAVTTENAVEAKAPQASTDFTQVITQAPELSLRKRAAIAKSKRVIRR